MPRRPKEPTQTRRFSDAENLPPSSFIEPDPDEESLSAILDQFGPGDLQIKVYKIQDGTESYCHTFTSPAEANEESVRKLGYGPGRYSLKIITSGVFRKILPMAIAERVDNVGAKPVDNGNNALMVMLQKQNELLLQAITRQNPPGEREPISALVEAVAKMQALNRPPELPIDTLLKAIEIGKGMGGATGDDDSVMGLIKEVLKSAGPALVPLLAGAARMPPPPSNLPEVRNVTPQPQAVVESQPDMLALRARLKLGIEFLKQKCLSGSDPEWYVGWIVENHEQPDYQFLIRFALTNEFSAFADLDAELKSEPFEKFFRAIYDGLRRDFGSTDTVAVDPAGKGGDNGNATGDEKVSKGKRGKS